MGRYSSKDCLLLVDGYDVMGEMTEVTDAVEAITEESTPFGEEWEKHKYVGLQSAELSQSGFFEDGAASVNEALNEKQGENRIYCLGYQGNTTGKAFAGFEGALQATFERVASKGTLHKANASYMGAGKVEEGRILHALAERAADGDTEAAGTRVDNGAQTTAGGSAYLQVTGLDLGGHTNVVIKVRDSADGTTWDDLETFTAVTSSPAVERKIKAGTIRRYLAASWEFTGAGSDPDITFFVGFCRN